MFVICRCAKRGLGIKPSAPCPRSVEQARDRISGPSIPGSWAGHRDICSFSFPLGLAPDLSHLERCSFVFFGPGHLLLDGATPNGQAGWRSKRSDKPLWSSIAGARALPEILFAGTSSRGSLAGKTPSGATPLASPASRSRCTVGRVVIPQKTSPSCW